MVILNWHIVSSREVRSFDHPAASFPIFVNHRLTLIFLLPSDHTQEIGGRGIAPTSNKSLI